LGICDAKSLTEMHIWSTAQHWILTPHFYSVWLIITGIVFLCTILLKKLTHLLTNMFYLKKDCSLSFFINKMLFYGRLEGRNPKYQLDKYNGLSRLVSWFFYMFFFSNFFKCTCINPTCKYLSSSEVTGKIENKINAVT
jgi:hypothetical protein